jgi:hypothetical protein
MTTTDPTPTPAAPDLRYHCLELLQALLWLVDDYNVLDQDNCKALSTSTQKCVRDVMNRARVALATPVPQQEAEISDEELDDLCSKFSFFTDDDESRDSLFEMFRAVWARAQAARQAEPLPQQGAGMSRESILEWLRNDPAWGVVIAPKCWRAEDDDLLELIQRAVAWARAQAARPAIQPVAVSEPVGFFPVEYADDDGRGIRILMEPADEAGQVCWVVHNSRHVNPCREFATPEAAYAAHCAAADQQEGKS